MSQIDPAIFEGGELPSVSPAALGFPLPAACEAGFAANARLLEHHWQVLRQATGLIAAEAERA
jgi:hypothetical protein